jgi:hypothetical protein
VPTPPPAAQNENAASVPPVVTIDIDVEWNGTEWVVTGANEAPPQPQATFSVAHTIISAALFLVILLLCTFIFLKRNKG